MPVNQSYVGQVTNPIVEARIDVAISSNVLARRLGLSRQYMSRAEQGTYSSLNPALIKWVANAMSWNTQSVQRRYAEFQVAKRRATVARVEPHQLMRHPSQTSQSGNELFARWRAGYWTSPTAFANDFCIHPDLIQKYEEGIQKTMPKQLRTALLEHGLLDGNWYDDLPRG